MSGWAANGSVGPRPEGAIDKLGKGITAGRRTVSKVLGEELPAVIVGCGDICIGALEKRDILLVPIPIAIVPKGLGIKLLLLVEHLRDADLIIRWKPCTC